MKKRFLALFSFGIDILILVVSCSKSYNAGNVSGSPVTVTIPINQLFASLRSTPQGLSVTAGRDTTIFGAQGTMIHFYPNSFKNASGSIISSGTINIQLIEMYKAGDMIANNATTLANGQILMSGGEVNIIATMNGQTVYANNYKLGFIHPGGSVTNMALFYGGNNNADSTTTWNIADTSRAGTRATGTRVDSTIGGSYASNPFFVFDSCTNFVMVNCDCYRNNDSPLTSVSVVVPDTSFNPDNTQIFVVLHDVNPWSLYSDTTTAVLSSDNQWGRNAYVKSTNTLSMINESNFNIVPAGHAYELVVMTLKNNTWYYYEESGTIPHNGIVTTARMTATTDADVKTKLSAL